MSVTKSSQTSADTQAVSETVKSERPKNAAATAEANPKTDGITLEVEYNIAGIVIADRTA